MEQGQARRTAARTAAVLVLALGTLEAAVAGQPDQGAWLRVLVGALSFASAPVALALWCRRCFEAHLLAVLVATWSALLALLGMAVGMPAQDPTGVTVGGAGVVVLGSSVVALAVVSRTRGHGPDPARTDPYA